MPKRYLKSVNDRQKNYTRNINLLFQIRSVMDSKGAKGLQMGLLAIWPIKLRSPFMILLPTAF